MQEVVVMESPSGILEEKEKGNVVGVYVEAATVNPLYPAAQSIVKLSTESILIVQDIMKEPFFTKKLVKYPPKFKDFLYVNGGLDEIQVEGWNAFYIPFLPNDQGWKNIYLTRSKKIPRRRKTPTKNQQQEEGEGKSGVEERERKLREEIQRLEMELAALKFK